MSQTLSIRVDQTNPNHHLRYNHGIWWIYYTVHPTPWTQKRVRQTLRTRLLDEARLRRDALFCQLSSREAD